MNKLDSIFRESDSKLDEIGQRLKEKEIRLPTDMVGAVLFMVLGIIVLLIMPSQVPVSEGDVIDGRVFPTMLMVLMISCSGLLLVQNIVKLVKKQEIHICTLNVLTEVKALIILGILFGTYIICNLTDLFILGALFCCVGFLLFFRCRKKSYYAITLGLAVVIWAAFRFGLNVRF